MSTIYQTADRAKGFKHWSLAHPPGGTDDHPGNVTPLEQPHRPWLVPGRDPLKQSRI